MEPTARVELARRGKGSTRTNKTISFVQCGYPTCVGVKKGGEESATMTGYLSARPTERLFSLGKESILKADNVL